MNKRILKTIVGVLAFFTGAIVAAAIIVWVLKAGDTSENASTLEDIEETIVSEDAGETQEIVYPKPEYEFKVDEITVDITGLENEYTIAFVNDMHMITDHKSGDVTEDNLTTVEERYETLSVTDEGIHSEDLWLEVIKYLNYNDFDAVVFGGDILDYCSNSNIKVLKNGIDELKYPADRIMYLRSDHDYGAWYGGSGFTEQDGYALQDLVLDGDSTRKVIEFEDFSIVGINKSYRNLSEHASEIINDELDKGKPVIIATHVPFYSDKDDTLKELSMEVRNKVYYWSKEGVNYVPDDVTQALIDRFYSDDSNVVQIVSAHMHASWDGYVAEGLKEHIFAPSFKGNIGIIHVRGGADEKTENKD